MHHPPPKIRKMSPILIAQLSALASHGYFFPVLVTLGPVSNRLIFPCLRGSITALVCGAVGSGSAADVMHDPMAGALARVGCLNSDLPQAPQNENPATASVPQLGQKRCFPAPRLPSDIRPTPLRRRTTSSDDPTSPEECYQKYVVK